MRIQNVKSQIFVEQLIGFEPTIPSSPTMQPKIADQGNTAPTPVRRAGPVPSRSDFRPWDRLQKTAQAERKEGAMPESHILFDIPGSEEPIERSFLESIECGPDGSSLEWRTRRVETVRDVFETIRPNDQHAGW